MSARIRTSRTHRLRTEFFDEGKRLDADPDTRELAQCWLCRMRIDYEVPASTTPDSHNLDHYFPVSTHPELQDDPDNWRHSHASCNQSRGNGDAGENGLGEPMPGWW